MRGDGTRVSALALVIPAPAVIRCALVIYIIMSTIIMLAVWYCQITSQTHCDLVNDALIMGHTIYTDLAMILDCINN